MPDYLPGKWLDAQRDQLAADFRRDIGFRNPAADVGQGSDPWLQSLVVTDATLPLYTYAHDIANDGNWQTASGPGLDVWIMSITGGLRLPAVGAVCAVEIETSAGGTVLQVGDTGTCNGFTYQVAISGSYSNGAQVVIRGVDTGPQTDQPAGSTFQWDAPRPGCNPLASVVLQPDGSGLSGGAIAETDDQAKQRLAYYKNNPPGAGNDADYQRVISKTPGVSVQQAFTFPAIMGPGSIGCTFTLRPPSPGASRIPNAQQLQLCYAYLLQYFPASDSIYMVTLASSPLTVVLRVQWATNAAGWADANVFPQFQAPSPGAVENNWLVTNAIVATPTTFNIKSLTDTAVPQAGQSIGVFDATGQTFRRKRILSATSASGGYNIVVDTTGGVSDLTFTPPTGALLSPWSDSLSSAIDPVLGFNDSLGPGEQFATFFDKGLRQKRSPASPALWPSIIGNRMLGGPANASQPFNPAASATPTLLGVAAMADVELAEVNASTAFPFTTPVGAPGVSAYLLALSQLAVYPEP